MGKNSVKDMFRFTTSPASGPSGDEGQQSERKPRNANSMGKDAEIALLTARVAELERSSVVDIRIDMLVIDPNRRRFRAPEKYRQLHDLIKSQGQTDPIKVFRREDGTVEVFEGHNRVEILRDLGKTTVKAIFLDGFDRLQAEKLAVTSNAVQSESSTYYIYSSMQRLLSLGIDVEESCDLVGIKPKTYAQIVHLDDFPASALDFLRTSGLKIGANRIIYLASLYKESKLSEPALTYVLGELVAGAQDALDLLIQDANEKFPSPDDTGLVSKTDGLSPTKQLGKALPTVTDISVSGKRIGKMVVKNNGATSISLGPKAPAELIEKIAQIIEQYK